MFSQFLCPMHRLRPYLSLLCSCAAFAYVAALTSARDLRHRREPFLSETKPLPNS
jgi:hypothetical protein